jgi:hypothetical protein
MNYFGMLTPVLDESKLDLLVSFDLDSEVEITEGIVAAFEASQIDVFNKSTVLQDWIEPAAYRSINWNRPHPVYLSTVIWDHRVVISENQIRIYVV